MKMDWNPVGAAVLGLALVCATFLVYTGKVPYAALAGLLGWLVPSPISAKKDEPEAKP